MKQEELTKELFSALVTLISGWVNHEQLDYTKGELGTLNYLYRNPQGMYPGELREKIHVGSGRMADILKSLESKGLISRRTDETDGRKTIVSSTEAGCELIHGRIVAVQKSMEGLTGYLGEQDTEELVRLLNAVDTYRRMELDN